MRPSSSARIACIASPWNGFNRFYQGVALQTHSSYVNSASKKPRLATGASCLLKALTVAAARAVAVALVAPEERASAAPPATSAVAPEPRLPAHVLPVQVRE